MGLGWKEQRGEPAVRMRRVLSAEEPTGLVVRKQPLEGRGGETWSDLSFNGVSPTVVLPPGEAAFSLSPLCPVNRPV